METDSKPKSTTTQSPKIEENKDGNVRLRTRIKAGDAASGLPTGKRMHKPYS